MEGSAETTRYAKAEIGGPVIRLIEFMPVAAGIGAIMPAREKGV